MNRKLVPEDLLDDREFELFKEVSHQNLKEFIVEQIREERFVIRIYSVYQVLMLLLFVFLFTRSAILSFKGHPENLENMVLAVVFSLSALIVIHELLHALAYLITGARKISFGLILKKFIFYALADRQVIRSRAFHLVALTPLVVVKLVCLSGFIAFFNQPLMYFFLGVMCLHSLFSAGDVAMLAFYYLNCNKEIFNFDDRSEGKTYFYIRKNNLT